MFLSIQVEKYNPKVHSELKPQNKFNFKEFIYLLKLFYLAVISRYLAVPNKLFLISPFFSSLIYLYRLNCNNVYLLKNYDTRIHI